MAIFSLNLVCMIEWRTTVHDGPVKIMAKCPFMPHLLLSVGGYSFAVWNEGVMVSHAKMSKTKFYFTFYMTLPQSMNSNSMMNEYRFRVNLFFNIS